MANAKKCDRCNTYYDEYGTANNKKECNSIIFANTDVNKTHFNHNIIDLCPDCMDNLKTFLFNYKETQL